MQWKWANVKACSSVEGIGCTQKFSESMSIKKNSSNDDKTYITESSVDLKSHYAEIWFDMQWL